MADDTITRQVSERSARALRRFVPRGDAGASLWLRHTGRCGDGAAGETVLDIGSGGGVDCFEAARLVGPSGRMIGVAVAGDMVACGLGGSC